MRIPEKLLKVAGLEYKKPTVPVKQRTFTEIAVEHILVRQGHEALEELTNERARFEVTNIFAGKDDVALRELIKKYGPATTESIAAAIDHDLQAIMGETTNYHSWTMGVIKGQPKSPAVGASSAPAR